MTVTSLKYCEFLILHEYCDPAVLYQIARIKNSERGTLYLISFCSKL